MTCIRQDGTSTWRRLHPFFAEHDITHLAVEQVLGLRNAFFGLVASGWDLDRFEQRGASKALPADALYAEHVVGLLDRERGAGTLWSIDEINDALIAALGPGARRIDETELAAIRTRRGAMFASWAATSAGKTLELTYSLDGVPDAR